MFLWYSGVYKFVSSLWIMPSIDEFDLHHFGISLSEMLRLSCEFQRKMHLTESELVCHLTSDNIV